MCFNQVIFALMDGLNEDIGGQARRSDQAAGLHAAVFMLSLEKKNKKVLAQMEVDGLWEITQIQIQAGTTTAG